MAARETSLIVQEALATLPPEQRAALVLVDVQGFSVEDAARVLDCAPGPSRAGASAAGPASRRSSPTSGSPPRGTSRPTATSHRQTLLEPTHATARRR